MMYSSKMLLFLYLLFQLFSVTFAAPVEGKEKCFKDFDVENSNNQNRILGGAECYPGQWPFAVQIMIGDDNCTGSIISSRYILTAAHCVIAPGDHSRAPRPPSDFKVIVGSIKYGQNGKIHEIEEIFAHEGSNEIGDNDITLLKLKNPIVFNDFAKPICLTKSFPKSFKKVVAIGFGATTKKLSKPRIGTKEAYEIIYAGGICKFVDIPLQKDSYCLHPLPKNKTLHFTPELEICGGGIWKGTLRGDSGGPLIGMYENGGYYQIGLTARGENVPEESSGSPKDFGVYTKISKYCDWIAEKSKNEVTCS